MCDVMQELQDSLEDWAVSLCGASSMKTDVSQYIITEDVLMLQEQEEHLHSQWEELCLKVRHTRERESCFFVAKSTVKLTYIPLYMSHSSLSCLKWGDTQGYDMTRLVFSVCEKT